MICQHFPIHPIPIFLLNKFDYQISAISNLLPAWTTSIFDSLSLAVTAMPLGQQDFNNEVRGNLLIGFVGTNPNKRSPRLNTNLA